jgi:serine/threonine protein kinase
MPVYTDDESFPKKHAIIFEGEEGTARLLSALLEEMEFGSIMSLPDGESVLNVVKNRHLNLLLVDLDALTPEGEAFIRKSLEIDPDLNIIVISSYATVEQSVELMKIGVMDVIRKPLDLGTVRNKISALMKMSRAERIKRESSLTIGRYIIQKEIERGGMGIIYRAKDAHTGDTVALKVLKTGRNAPIEQVLRFHREASTIAKLHHPYIVAVLDTGFSGDDYFIAMQYIEGRSLDEAVYENEIDTVDAVEILIKSLDAIDYAHRMNIIHRDLKPPNILLDESLDPHIIDFGLATYVKGNVRLTRTGIVMGTIGYIAPERIKGLEADARVDIFSLGAILYEALTKKIPYETDSRVISVPTSYDELIPVRHVIPDVPSELEAVVQKALAIEPDDRYQTAGDFYEALVNVRKDM